MKNLRYLFHFLSFYPVRTAVLIFVILLSALSEFLSLSLFVPILDYIQQGPNLVPSNRILSIVLDGFAFMGLETTLFNLLLFALLASLFQFAMVFAQETTAALLFFPVRKKVRDQCFINLMHTSVSYFVDKKSGDITNILTDRVNHVGYAINGFVHILADSLLIATYLLFALLISWQISVIILAVAVLKYLVTMPFLRRSRRLGVQWLERANRQTTRLLESLQAIQLVKSMSRETYEIKRFDKVTKELADNQTTYSINSALMLFVDSILAPVSFCVIIYVALERLHLSGSYILIFLLALMKMIPKLTKINNNRNQLKGNLANMNAIFDLFDKTNKPYIKEGSKVKKGFHKSVEFKGVSFAYEKNIVVLDDVSFSIPKGSCVAIVGASGSGKTTVINLLLRLYEPTRGEIDVDDEPLSAFNLASWHDLVGIVQQDNFIFNDTVRNNIHYGDFSATEKDIIEAAKKAHIHDFIAGLPDGYNTLLGERGVKLSGGQRQRLAIARAILKRPDILIFDEATSSLDTISEQMIQESIDEISQECTTILVAHRLSTVRRADKIIVLDSGKIIETGDHETLMALGGKYYEYHNAQSRMGETSSVEVEL